MTTPDEQEAWLLGLIEALQRGLSARKGDSVTLPLDTIAHAQSALISNLGAWRDAARLNWLDARGALWTVRMSGVEMGKGRIRDAINLAILRAEGASVPAETRGEDAEDEEDSAPPTEGGDEPAQPQLF